MSWTVDDYSEFAEALAAACAPDWQPPSYVSKDSICPLCRLNGHSASVPPDVRKSFSAGFDSRHFAFVADDERAFELGVQFRKLLVL